MCNGRSKSLDGPEGPQDGSRIAQDGSRMSPRWPKLLRMGPGWLQDGSVRAFIRSLRPSEALRALQGSQRLQISVSNLY